MRKSNQLGHMEKDLALQDPPRLAGGIIPAVAQLLTADPGQQWYGAGGLKPGTRLAILAGGFYRI